MFFTIGTVNNMHGFFAGTFRTMNKKPFKPLFNNPLKKPASPPEREIISLEHGEWTQIQITVMHVYF